VGIDQTEELRDRHAEIGVAVHVDRDTLETRE
jgi:hypothetical protein